MAGLNKVQIIGRLGNDPDTKVVGNSAATVTTFSVATSEKWKDKAGNMQERTEWHRVTVWNKLAEICGKHLAKGRQVYVEGKLQTRMWEKDGEKRYATDIVAHEVQFLGSAPQQEGSPADRESIADYTGSNNNSTKGLKNHAPGADYGFQDFGPGPSFNSNEDIPF